MTEFLPWQDRVIQEKAELDDKLLRLSSFIVGAPEFDDLKETEKELLIKQESLMSQYSEVLDARIDGFRAA
jgi:hypothetical protein